MSAHAGTIREGREHDEATEVIQDEFAATGHGVEASERRAILQVCFAGESRLLQAGIHQHRYPTSGATSGRNRVPGLLSIWIDSLKPVLHTTLPEELRGIVAIQNDQAHTKPRPMDLSVATATRTLQAAGFDITNVARHPAHIEYECEREDAFGAVVRYLVVIAAGNEPPSEVAFADREALAAGRTVVIVAGEGGPTWLSWNEFLGVLGGAVPSWRALDDSFPDAIRTASRNELPAGTQGEAWRIFEEAVADGLEFAFGQRVKRMGGVQRFKALPDMLALTPDGLLMLVDAKAAGGGLYELERPKLRALGEYVQRQRARQAGSVPLGVALIVAGSFEPVTAVDTICNDFMAQAQVPLALLRVETLLGLVRALRDNPPLRPKLRWRHLFVRTGLVPSKLVDDELTSARNESWSRELNPDRGNVR